MGDLRLKAQEILKLKQMEKENESQKSDLSLEELIIHKKSQYREEFKDRIKNEIDDFQSNLLSAANRGEPLKIKIFEMDKDLFDDHNSVKALMQYLPIQQRIATFLDDTNFAFITDEIIVDDTLQKLYDSIVAHGIYPTWKTGSSFDNKKIILFLEVNPMNNYEERQAEIQRKKDHRNQIEKQALVLYKQSLNLMNQERKRDRIKNALLIFFSSLYISVMILTVLSSAVGLLPSERLSETLSLVTLGWPYYIFTDLQGAFIFSLPIGLAISLYLAFKRS